MERKVKEKKIQEQYDTNLKTLHLISFNDKKFEIYFHHSK